MGEAPGWPMWICINETSRFECQHNAFRWLQTYLMIPQEAESWLLEQSPDSDILATRSLEQERVGRECSKMPRPSHRYPPEFDINTSGLVSRTGMA